MLSFKSTLLVFAALWPATGFTTAQASLQARAQSSASGQVVRGADGAPQNYTQTEWRAAPPPRALALAGPGAGARVAAATARNDAPVWAYAAYGSGIGLSGIVTARNNEAVEAYLGGSTSTFGSNTMWQALRFAPGSVEPEQVFISSETPSPILQIALARTGTGQPSRILVALESGQVLQYDQSSKALLARGAGPCAKRGGLTAFTTADLDADGSDETLSICGNETLVATGAGYAGWSRAGVGGTRLLVAQLDQDPSLEIVSNIGKVIDVASRTVQWKHGAGFGLHLQAADVDGDGIDDLIAAESWYQVHAYDVKAKALRWTIDVELDIDAIRVADVDGDGVPELLVGDGQWGSLHAFDLVAQVEKGAIANPEHGVTHIVVADVDLDGKSELLWGSGHSSTGSDHLYVADWSARKISWQSIDLTGPFVGPVTGDLDGDGQPEIVFASTASESNYGSGRIIVLDGRTLKLRGMSAGVVDDLAWTGLHDLKLRDIDGDGRLEILVAADRLYDGAIEAYRYTRNNKFRKVWSNSSQPSGAPFYSVEAVDLDGDGQVEIIGGVGAAHSGAEGIRLYAYAAGSGAELWHTKALPDGSGPVTSLAIADFDLDGRVEIAALSKGGKVHMVDAVSHKIEASVGTRVTALAFGGLPFGKAAWLVLGDETGRLGYYAPYRGRYVRVLESHVADGAIDGVNFASPNLLWLGSGGVLLGYRELELVLRAYAFGATFGERVVKAPAGGLWLSSGDYGVFGFALP